MLDVREITTAAVLAAAVDRLESKLDQILAALPELQPAEPERAIRVSEALRQFPIRKSALYDAIKSGKIPALQWGRAKAIYPSDLRRFLEAGSK